MLSSAAEFISKQAATHAFIYYLTNRQQAQLQASAAIMEDQQQQAGASTNNKKKKAIHCISFNQDGTSLAVGHDDGYILYSLSSLVDEDDPLEMVFNSKVPQRACIVERMFNSSLITAVSMNRTRKMQAFHKEKEISSHTYASSIVAVRMNRKRVIVCLEDIIHIHNLPDMRLLCMKSTPANPQGIVDLSNDDQNCFLAFPSSSGPGHVHIFDTDSQKTVLEIAAHDGMLAAVRFNPDGNKLATGSEKGTVIRVFALPSGDRLFEFMRGLSRVQIHSLAFSQDSRHLCLSSNTDTVHIFSLVQPMEMEQPPPIQKSVDETIQQQNQQQEGEEGGSVFGVASAAYEAISASAASWMNWATQMAADYLPQPITDLMQRRKSSASAHLPMVGTRTAVAMPRIQGTDHLLVATLDGCLFRFSLPVTESTGELVGQCQLVRQYRIGPDKEEAGGIRQTRLRGNNNDDTNNTTMLYPELAQSPTTTKRPTTLRGDDQQTSSFLRYDQITRPTPSAPPADMIRPTPSAPPGSPRKLGMIGSGGNNYQQIRAKDNGKFVAAEHGGNAVREWEMLQVKEDKLMSRREEEKDDGGKDAGGTQMNGSSSNNIMAPVDLDDSEEGALPPTHHHANAN